MTTKMVSTASIIDKGSDSKNIPFLGNMHWAHPLTVASMQVSFFFSFFLSQIIAGAMILVTVKCQQARIWNYELKRIINPSDFDAFHLRVWWRRFREGQSWLRVSEEKRHLVESLREELNNFFTWIIKTWPPSFFSFQWQFL
jgi:hypothetical protein